MPELGVPKFKATAIRDMVADALRRSLFEGRFRPGQDLSDAALASEFQISRGPVREAMLLLAEEGLLTHTHNRGFSVLNFTLRDLAQINLVRVGLESVALGAAREHVTEHHLKLLNERRDELVRYCEAGHHAGRVHAEVEFHTAIWEMSENPWLVASLKRVVIPQFTYGTALLPLTGSGIDEIERVRRIHSLYTEFLSGSDAYTPEECVRIHLRMS